jgi:hypothetical protein
MLWLLGPTDNLLNLEKLCANLADVVRERSVEVDSEFHQDDGRV